LLFKCSYADILSVGDVAFNGEASFLVDIVPSNAESSAVFPHWFVVSLPFACGFLLVVVLTAVLIRVASKRGWVAHPRQDRWSKRTVAKFGGIPILLGFSAAMLLGPVTREMLELLLLTWGMALLGLVDDIVGLGPRSKLLGQITLAGLALSTGVIHHLSGYFWVDAFATIFWIVAITNAFNLLDNMDSLAAGIALLGLVQIGFLAGPDVTAARFALCMFFAIAGFLPFNINPARIFMGDTGALALGFFLACISIKASAHLYSLASALVVPCLVVFVPIFDMLLVSVTRRANGRPISLGARDHASHRLALIGLGERQAVGLLCLIAMIAGTMAFLWESPWPDLGAGAVGMFVVGASLFWMYLAELRLPQAWLSSAEFGARVVPEFLQQRAKRATHILIDGALIALGLYFAWVITFHHFDGTLWGRFFLVAALSLAVKMPLLVAFGAYRTSWRAAKSKDLVPILQMSLAAALVLAAASVVLPQNIFGWSILLSDMLLTTVFLSVGRASGLILDGLLARHRLRLDAGASVSSPGSSQVAESAATTQRVSSPDVANGHSASSEPAAHASSTRVGEVV